MHDPIECMYRGCDNNAVSRCFSERPDSPLNVCFTHERELVDRYGFEDVRPQSLYEWPHDVMAAVNYLRHGTTGA